MSAVGPTQATVKFKNAPAKYMSKVWKYFDISENNERKVVYKFCLSDVAYSRTTTNIANHDIIHQFQFSWHWNIDQEPEEIKKVDLVVMYLETSHLEKLSSAKTY